MPRRVEFILGIEGSVKALLLFVDNGLLKGALEYPPLETHFLTKGRKQPLSAVQFFCACWVCSHRKIFEIMLFFFFFSCLPQRYNRRERTRRRGQELAFL